MTDDKPSSKAPPPDAVSLEESDFVVILAALLCALICVVGLATAARCAWRRRRNANRRPSQPANKGLKKKVLQSLPKFTYTTSSEYKSASGSNDSVKSAALSSECAICLGEFMEGDEVRVLPQCGHGFHVVCIDKWLGSHSSCPSCRQILVVARCQKCGEFPAAGSGGGGEEAVVVTEAQLKAREDSFSNVNNNAFLP